MRNVVDATQLRQARVRLTAIDWTFWFTRPEGRLSPHTWACPAFPSRAIRLKFVARDAGEPPRGTRPGDFRAYLDGSFGAKPEVADL